jgi:hypothetical protein
MIITGGPESSDLSQYYYASSPIFHRFLLSYDGLSALLAVGML